MLTDGRQDNGNPDAVAPGELSRQQRDFIDLNNEIAGRETGRAHRFLREDREGGPLSQKQKEERELTRLLRLLQDPNYARLYYRAEKELDRAADAVGAALAKNARERDASLRHLQEMKDTAGTLPDGRKVFRDASGHVYTEDGDEVTEQAQRLPWPNGAATWEEFSKEKKRLDAIAGQRVEIEDYRDRVLTPAQERMRDADNPPSKSELERILKEAPAKMPAAVREQFEPEDVAASATVPTKNAAADAYLESSGLDAPDLTSEFNTAHDGPLAQVSPAPGALLTPKA